MIITMILPVYLLLNAYLCLRIRSFFAGRAQKILFTVAYAAMALTLPVAGMLSRAGTPAWIRFALAFGYLSLPFLLYLFLLMVILDILLALNRLLKIIPPAFLLERGVRTALLCLLFAVPAGIVYWGTLKFSDLRVNRYSIEIPRKSSPLRHLRIALASDFHLRETTDGHFMEHFADQVNSLNADILLIPGDVVEGDRQEGGEFEEMERQFRRIRTTYGSYASLGNHEFYGRRGRPDFFRASGIAVLEDTAVVIASAFTIVGRKDSHAGDRMPVGELVRTTSERLPVIVLDHRPTDLESISATGTDIAVSGHTHNGQLFPFNYITAKIYEVSWGYKKIRNTNVFVTSGVRLWGPPVRTTGDSEIMLIDVDLADR